MTTPTFFSRNGRDLPLPEPVLAVRSLLVRWNALAPVALRVSDADAKALVGAVFLDAVSGSTRKVDLGPGLRQVGFEGTAEFRLLKSASAQVASVFGALTRFAAFAGLGAQTALGFGSVDVEFPGSGSVAGATAGFPRPQALVPELASNADDVHQRAATAGPSTAAEAADPAERHDSAPSPAMTTHPRAEL